MVRLHQQQGVRAFALGRLAHRILQRVQEGGAVEQSGDHVALAQVLDLARQLGVEVAAPPEHHLHAGFALVAGGGELERGREGLAFHGTRLQFEPGWRCLALAQLLEHGLEIVDVLR